jgi:hypothetical protein
MESATRKAILSGSNSILKHIDESMIQYKGYDWSEDLIDHKGNRMPEEEWESISNMVLNMAANKYEIQVNKNNRFVVLQTAMDEIYKDWTDLEAEERTKYDINAEGKDNETPFGNWLKDSFMR